MSEEQPSLGSKEFYLSQIAHQALLWRSEQTSKKRMTRVEWALYEACTQYVYALDAETPF